jgi:hypothetical protein
MQNLLLRATTTTPHTSWSLLVSSTRSWRRRDRTEVTFPAGTRGSNPRVFPNSRRVSARGVANLESPAVDKRRPIRS